MFCHWWPDEKAHLVRRSSERLTELNYDLLSDCVVALNIRPPAAGVAGNKSILVQMNSIKIQA